MVRSIDSEEIKRNLDRGYQNHFVIPEGTPDSGAIAIKKGVVRSISEQIQGAYGFEPQAVRQRNVVGFNVHGREAGRVRVDGRRISWSIYIPDLRELPFEV